MNLRQAYSPTTVALVAVFAGLIAASTVWPGIPVGGSVPISLQTFAVLLAGAVLGPWRGASAVVIYLVLGTAGLPIFAQRQAGPGIWAKPTAGFLASFVVAAFVVGWLVRAFRRAHRLSLGAILLSTAIGSMVVINLIGWTWVSRVIGSHLRDTVAMALPFVPGDIAKLVLAAVVAWAVHRAYPGLLTAGERLADSTPALVHDPEADASTSASA